MELWYAYNEDGTLAGFDLIRGEGIPSNYFHLVSEAVIQHTDGDYLLMQRSFEKENFPAIWEIGAGGSALKGELIKYYDSEQYPPRLRERLKDFINSIR